MCGSATRRSASGFNAASNRGVVEAVRVPERNLARALPGPDFASFVDEFFYPAGGRVVRDAVDPDVEEVGGNYSNTFDLS